MKTTIQTIGLTLLVVLAGVVEISRSGATEVSEKKSARTKVAKQAVRVGSPRQVDSESALQYMELENGDKLDEGSDYGTPGEGQAPSAAASQPFQGQAQHIPFP